MLAYRFSMRLVMMLRMVGRELISRSVHTSAASSGWRFETRSTISSGNMLEAGGFSLAYVCVVNAEGRVKSYTFERLIEQLGFVFAGHQFHASVVCAPK